MGTASGSTGTKTEVSAGTFVALLGAVVTLNMIASIQSLQRFKIQPWWLMVGLCRPGLEVGMGQLFEGEEVFCLVCTKNIFRFLNSIWWKISIIISSLRYNLPRIRCCWIEYCGVIGHLSAKRRIGFLSQYYQTGEYPKLPEGPGDLGHGGKTSSV